MVSRTRPSLPGLSLGSSAQLLSSLVIKTFISSYRGQGQLGTTAKKCKSGDQNFPKLSHNMGSGSIILPTLCQIKVYNTIQNDILYLKVVSREIYFVMSNRCRYWCSSGLVSELSRTINVACNHSFPRMVVSSTSGSRNDPLNYVARRV